MGWPVFRNVGLAGLSYTVWQTYMICRRNPFDILCRYRGRPDYLVMGQGSGIWVRDRANGSIQDREVNYRVTSLQSRREPSPAWGIILYQPPQCKGQSSLPQWRGQDQRSTKVHAWLVSSRAIREKVKRSRSTSACPPCSWCHVSQYDCCNPGHHYIRWPSEP
jgi:hypothetical protein